MTGKRLELLAFLGVMIIYAGLTSYKLADYPPIGYDDFASAQPAYQLLTQGHFASAYSIPWYVNHFLMFISFKVFGLGVVQIKLGAVFMGAILILITYLIAKKLFSAKVATIAILLLVADAAFFNTARWGRPDIVAAAFFMLSFYVFLLARERQSNFLFSLSAIALGASVFSHENGLFLGVPIMYLLLLLDLKGAFFKRSPFWAFSLTLLLVALPYVINIALNFSDFKREVGFFISTSGESIGGFVFYHQSPFSLFSGEVTERWRGYIANNSLTFGLFLLAIINGIIKRDKSSRLIVIIVIAMQLLFILIKKNSFYLVWMTPLLYILLSSLFVDSFYRLVANSKGRILELFKSNRFAVLLAAFLIFVVVFSASLRIVEATLGSDSYGYISAQLNGSLPPEAKVLGPGLFWLALHNDKNLQSYGLALQYATEKRKNAPDFSVEQAIYAVLEDLRPDYVIYQENDIPAFLPVRLALKQFFVDSRSVKETVIAGGPSYGEIEVWKINWNEK